MDMQDKIIEKLVEMDSKLDLVVTSRKFGEFQDEVRTNFDNQSQILRRLDQERMFTAEHVRRIEADVEMLKKHLHLA